MWTLALTIIGLAWLLVVTIMMAALIRHVGALQVVVEARADVEPDFSFEADGPPVPSVIPSKVLQEFEDAGVSTEQDQIVVFLSAGCLPCRERASEIVARQDVGPSIFLVTGGDRRHGLEELRELLTPSGSPIIYDPVAFNIVKGLNINLTPFAFRISHGGVIAKTYLRNGRDIERILEGDAAESPMGALQ